MLEAHLKSLIEAYAVHVDRAPATVARKAGGYARLHKRLEDGDGFGIRTFSRMMNWFDENWPDDLEWPSDIPRPSSIESNSDAA